MAKDTPMPETTHARARPTGGAPVLVLILHVAAGVTALLLGRWSKSAAAHAEAWHLLAGALVWLAVLIHPRLHALAADEAMEAELNTAKGWDVFEFNERVALPPGTSKIWRVQGKR